jgi:hypothetical protein
MTLREKQSLFVVLVARLIQHATALGYALSFGEAWRSPEEAARLAKRDTGIARSLHTQRLAIDLNLFKDGVYLRTADAHRPLGEWWKAQSTADYTCAWGGDFASGDANHYSIAHGGRQ